MKSGRPVDRAGSDAVDVAAPGAVAAADAAEVGTDAAAAGRAGAAAGAPLGAGTA